jgi:hypothetical protein
MIHLPLNLLHMSSKQLQFLFSFPVKRCWTHPPYIQAVFGKARTPIAEFALNVFFLV